jgi:putative copper resistance protein D
MSIAYHSTVFLHVLAALVWLGGMLALALLAPILRDVGDEGVRQRLFHRLGVRFRAVGWVCIAVLITTGVLQLRARGWWGTAVLGSTTFWAGPLGRALAWKLLTVAVILAVQAVHDFRLGPRAGQVPAGTPEARTLRRRAAHLARLNAVVGLILVWFAVALARGG